MLLRFHILLQQNTSGSHALEDCAGRHGGELVDANEDALSTMTFARRTEAEKRGEIYLRLDESGALFWVIDGVGGAALGGQAARLVDAGLQRGAASAGHLRLGEALAALNEAVCALGVDADGRSLGACAATVARFDDAGGVLLGHSGDTVGYQYHRASGRLRRLTASGDGSKVIRDYLGQGPGVAAQVVTVAAQVGDLILLCSDGVSKGMRDSAIETALSRRCADVVVDLRRAAAEIATAARKGGSDDDISIVLVEVVGQDP